MNPFWHLFYDRVKDRRYGSLFLLTLGVMGLVLFLFFLAGAFSANVSDQQQENIVAIVLGIPVIFLALILRAIIKSTRRGNGRSERQQMSRDEIIKARSKLLRSKS